MALNYSCFHVPEKCEERIKNLPVKKLVFENHHEVVELQVPALNPESIAHLTDALKFQQQTYLGILKTNDIIEIINEAVQKWLDPRYELRQFAEHLLPIITGYDPEMVRLFLNRYLREFRKEKLERMIDEDFPNPLILDEFRPRKSGGLYRAYGPELITHIFSGNVPALPLWSLTAGLLLKSATLGKVSSSEPLFPVLFAKTLKEIDPQFADGLAILSWKGGDEALEKESFSRSNAVVAYGGKETIESIKQKVPSHVPLQSHGNKVSFGVITNECLSATKGAQTAKLVASDVSWFDQQGCLSPHVFFVERNGKYSASDFAEMLANEMANFQHKHPRADLTDEEQHAIVKLRSTIELESFENNNLHLIQSHDTTAWTVVYRDLEENNRKDTFPFSPLNRFVTVIPVDSILDVKQYINELKGYIQTVGVGCSPQSFSSIISMLGESGVNRICALGSMPHPQPGWHHDGRFHLADLVHFCDVEASLEDLMDDFDPFRI